MKAQITRVLTLLLLSAIPLAISAQVPTGFSTTPSFDEEFNTTSLDTTKWIYRAVGTVRGGCTITSDAIAVNSGYMRSSIYTSGGTTYCGMISTTTGFTQRYGYWEANMRFHRASGDAGAFWLQSPTTGAVVNDPWRTGVEMDILEYQSGFTDPTYWDTGLVWGGYGIPQTTVNNSFQYSTALDDGNFHKFGMAWTPSGYTFYLDGTVVRTVNTQTVPVSDIPEYVILGDGIFTPAQVQSGGYGSLGSTSNAWMDVDYVKVYPISAAPTIQTLQAVQTGSIRDGDYANTNYSGSSDMVVKKDAASYNRRSLFQFDLTGVTGTVKQATLYVTSTLQGRGDLLTQAWNVPTNTWLESTLTWNNQPATGTALGGVMSTCGYSAPRSTCVAWMAGDLVTFDVTPAVTAGNKVTIELQSAETTAASDTLVDFAGRTYTTDVTKRPFLLIVTQ